PSGAEGSAGTAFGEEVNGLRSGNRGIGASGHRNPKSSHLYLELPGEKGIPRSASGCKKHRVLTNPDCIQQSSYIMKNRSPLGVVPVNRVKGFNVEKAASPSANQ